MSMVLADVAARRRDMVREMTAKGYGLAVISHALGISTDTVSSYQKQMGIRPEKHVKESHPSRINDEQFTKDFLAGLSDRQLCEKWNIGEKAIRDHRTRLKLRRTPAMGADKFRKSVSEDEAWLIKLRGNVKPL